jgi:hypothetical protein
MSALGIANKEGGIGVWEAESLPGQSPWFFLFPRPPAFRGGEAGGRGNRKNQGDCFKPRNNMTTGAPNTGRPTRKNP